MDYIKKNNDNQFHVLKALHKGWDHLHFSELKETCVFGGYYVKIMILLS